jgi:hypothetical protein
MSIVTRTWSKVPGDYFFICTKSRSGKWSNKAFHRDEFDQVDDYIDENSDKDLYWCVHGFTKPRRLEEYAVRPKLLWADLDEADPKKMNGTRPTMAWESSPGRYAGVWHIDRTMTKELNRRLSYSIGADKGGWDLTQVLRIPGTRNYKYGKNGAPGRLLWNKPNEIVSVAKLKQHLTEPERAQESKRQEYSKEDAKKVYERYQKRIDPGIRKLLLAQKVIGTRSEVLWKMWHGLFDAGMDVDEAIALITPTVWNKFADRPAQLRREAEKIISERLTSGRLRDTNPQAASDESDRGYITMDNVVMKPVTWVTPGWLPEGKITIIEGDPGVGKSWLAQYMCISTINGDRVPCTGQYGQRGAREGRVMYIDLENDPSTDTKSRLIDMGLDEDKLGNFMQYYRPFSLTDFEEFEEFEKLVEAFKPRIIVFDTIMLYMGSSDTHKASDVQQTLSRLSLIAQQYSCAVVLIRHLGKSSRDNIKHAGLGSIAFTGMARMVHLVRVHPNDEELTVVKTIKANFCRPEPALKFHIESLPPKRGRFNRARLAIDGFDHDLRDSDLMGNNKKNDKKNDNTPEDPAKARKFLEEFLSKGERPLKKVRIEAETRAITERMLDRMILELGVVKINRGKDVWLRLRKAQAA